MEGPSTTTATTDEGHHQGSIIPMATFVIIEYFVMSCIFVFAVFGIITNVINILVFRRQGFLSNSSTVCLSVLAMSDLCYCVFAMMTLPLAVARNVLDWRPDIVHWEIYAIRPADYFSQITCWVTAYAAFERMVSVVLPFKVRTMFSSKRSLVAIICLCVGFLILHFPFFLDRLPGWTENPSNVNKTIYGIRVVSAEIVDIYSFNISILRFVTVTIVILCNLIISSKVKLSHKFRKNIGSSHGNKENISRSPETKGDSQEVKDAPVQNVKKEAVLLRMIMVISAVFTLSYSMNVIYYVVFYLVYQFYSSQYYLVLDYIGFVVVMGFQTANSSTNSIIYYTMSSRYREEFLSLLRIMRQK